MKKIQTLLQVIINLFYLTKSDIVSVSSSLESDNNPVGSIYGGFQLFIKGSGFDIITFDNQIKIGNYDCPIINYYTSEYLLSCIVPFEYFIDKDINNAISGDRYILSITSKGKQHACSKCEIKFDKDNSPYVQGIARNHITSGDKLKVVGFFKLSAENLVEDILLGDGYRCEILGEKNLSQNSTESDIECIFDNIPPGEYQMNMKVNDSTGRALIMDQAKSVNLITGKSYAVKIFPKITSFNSQQIFQSGGIITIQGQGFGNDKSKIIPELQFQNSDYYTYQVIDVNDTEMKIEFQKKTGTIDVSTEDKIFYGGPGLEHRLTPHKISISSYESSSTYPNYADQIISLKLSLEHYQQDVRYVQRYQGIFLSQAAGSYNFWVAADDEVKITLKKVDIKQVYSESNPDFTCSFDGWDDFRKYFQFKNLDDINKCKFTLEANTAYYINVFQRDIGGDNHLTVSLSMPNPYTGTRQDEHPQIITIKVNNKPIKEVFSITQVNATSGTFDIYFQSRKSNGDFSYNKHVANVPYNATAVEMKNKIKGQTGWNIEVTRQFLNSSQNIINDEISAKGYKWIVTFEYHRSQTMLPFLVQTNLVGSNIILTKQQDVSPSPRISGKFKIKINDETSQFISHNSSWKTVFDQLRQFKLFFKTGIQVSRNGNDYTGYYWSIILSGSKNVNVSIVESTIAGGDPNQPITVDITQHIQNSNDLFQYQIPPELLRTFYNQPQLNIKIDSTYAACVNRNCNISTIPLVSVPQIDSYSITSNTITFVLNNTYTTLTQYDYTNTNFEIEFAGYQCNNINSSSLPNITCDIQLQGSDQLVSAGTWKPKVQLKNYGYLEHSLSDTIFQLIVDTITPLEGAPGGNTLITINGKRFDKNIQVQINSQTCIIQSQTFSQITCLTPANSEASYDVIINQNGQTNTFGTKFEYKASLIATINSFTPTNASPVLKSTLTIDGSGFDITKTGQNYNTKVFLKNSSDNTIEYKCFIMTITATQITCRLGGGVTGDYNIIIQTTQGIVKSSTLFALRSTITNIDINQGSTLGGNLLTITGTNFSTVKNENLIAIGDDLETYYCDVQSATSTQLTCITRPLQANSKFINQTTNITIKQKLAEYSVCQTTCTFTLSTSLDVSVTNLDKTEFVKNELIEIDVDKTLTTSDEVKLLMVQGDIKKEVLLNTISGNTLKFIMPETIYGSYTLGLISKKGTGKFTVGNVIINKLQIDSINKTEGYLGGNEILINGNGFDNTMTFYIKSTNHSCRYQQVISPSQVKCILKAQNNNQNNLIIFLKDKNNNTINCSTCSYNIKTENYTENTMTPNTANTKDFTFTLTFNNTPTLSEVTGVSLYNDQTKIETNGTFSVNDQTLNLNFTDMNYGSYYVFVKTANGFYRVNSQFEVINNPSTNVINNIISSYMGGMQGTFNIGKVTSDLKVFVCGLEAKIIDYTEGNTKYETPILSTSQVINEYDLKQGEKILPQTVLKTNVSSEQNLYDNDITTGISYSSNCEFTYDFGEGYQVMLSLIKIFPKLNNNLNMIGAIVQGSNDNTNYNTLHTYNEEFHEKWTEKTFNFSQKYRYIKFKSQSCQIAEFEVYGKKILNNTIDLISHKCPLKITMGSINIEQNDVVEYRQDATPKITSVSPEFLISSGGNVTVNGNNLTTNCVLQLDNVNSTSVTNSSNYVFVMPARTTVIPHDFKIKCEKGNAALMGKDILYMDRWSSTDTWGQDFKPIEGDSVFVPKGQTLLVDESPPKLKLVNVEGMLIFEDKDINFDIHYLVVRGGELRAGTSLNPFQNKLIITLHGKKYDNALPGMGNKFIGIINGKLKFYGSPRTPTWTRLQNTASIGNNTITLIEEVNWKIGDKLIIATTSRNRKEFEERYITAISNDKKILTLDKTLQYNHYAGEHTYGTRTVQLRGEVANFTRQIVVQGDDTSVNTKHGSHIMFRGSSDLVRGEISQIETRNCGQLFNMGRYPLHFHMIGNVNGSFIDGCSVYNSFNRGTTVHGVHYLQIKNSVYFKHEGHGIFIEDSVESQNTITGNLVMHSNKATALLFSDLTPGGMWITRPNNYINNNTVVGSQSFGFWFDLPGGPTGPSRNVKNVCPVGEKVGSFENNISHGNGIGLRIYPQWLPKTYQCKSQFNFNKINSMEDNPSNRQFLRTCILWNNSLGFFNKKGGTYTLEGFSFISNSSQLSFSKPSIQIYSEMTSVKDAIFVGKSPAGDLHGIESSSTIGLGQKDGLIFKNIKVYNSTGIFINACGGCDPLNPMSQTKGVIPSYFSEVLFSQSTFTHLIKFNHPEYGMDLIFDEDGTLFSSGVGKITPYLKHLDNSSCNIIEDTQKCSTKCLFCPNSVVIRRMELKIRNNHLRGLTLKVFNMDQSGFTNNLTSNDNFSVLDYRVVDSFKGWTWPVILGKKYNLHFSTGTTFQYFYLQNNNYWTGNNDVHLRFNITADPGPELYQVNYTGFENDNQVSNKPIQQDNTLAQGTNFAVYNYFKTDTTNKYLEFGISEQSIGSIYVEKVNCKFTCPKEPEQEQEEDFKRYWSKANNWKNEKIPVKDEDVIIEAGWIMIYDIETSPILGSLTINGTLQFNDIHDLHVLKTQRIFIRSTGKLIIGTSEQQFTKKAKIILYGNQQSKQTQISQTIEDTNKSIVNAGSIEINSQSSNINYVKLAKNAFVGENSIIISKQVDWKVGDEIAISSTSQKHDQYEKVTITVINQNVITFTPSLVNNHYGQTEINTTNGVLDMRAEVILLSRNVEIIGDSEGNWGCTVQTIGYRTFDTNQQIYGQMNIKGVRIRECGQHNAEEGALAFLDTNDNQKQQIVENCTISDGLGIGISARNTQNLKIRNTNVYSVVKTGVSMNEVKNGEFVSNVIMGIRKRYDYQNLVVLDLLNGFQYDSNQFLEANNFLIKDNIISSAPWFAWVVPGYSCQFDDVNNQVNFRNNVGHSSMAGWFGNKVSSQCQKYSQFIAYRNVQQGFANRFMIFKLYVDKFILSDNGNALALNGGATSEKDYPFSEVKNTVIYGQQMINCSFCYDNEVDCNTNGIITSLFEIENFELEFNEYKLPLHNVTHTTFEWGGRQYINNVEFKNFQNNKPSCQDSNIYAIRTNQFTQDTSVYFKILKSTIDNVDDKNKFFFYNHTRIKHPGFCNKRDCTGIYNILIDDLSGQFDKEEVNYQKQPRQYFGYNKGLNDGNCTFYKDWNGHRCNQVYQLLSIKKTDRDRGPIISPIQTSVYQFGYEGNEFNHFLSVTDNFNQIPNIVKLNSYQKIQFSQSMKNGNYYKLDNYNDNQWAVFRIQQEDPAIMATYINGQKQTPLVVKDSEQIDWSQYASKCGTHTYFNKNQTLIWVMNGQSSCEVHVKILNAIKVEMALTIDPISFYKDVGETTFIDRIASTLLIHPSRIKIVGIRKGSTIIDFYIEPENESETTNNNQTNNEDSIKELNNVTKKLKESVEQISQDLGVEVKSLESNLVANKPDDFEKKCRFYSYTSWLLISSYEQLALYTDDGRTFKDVTCINCVVSDDCEAMLPLACYQHKEFMGTKCNNTEVPTGNNEKESDKEKSKNIGKINTFLIIFLILFK